VGIAGFELTKGLGLAVPAAIDVPVFRIRPDPAMIAATVERHLGDAGARTLPIFLVAGHGATAWAAISRRRATVWSASRRCAGRSG